jgi:hypothetical protein
MQFAFCIKTNGWNNPENEQLGHSHVERQHRTRQLGDIFLSLRIMMFSVSLTTIFQLFSSAKARVSNKQQGSGETIFSDA